MPGDGIPAAFFETLAGYRERRRYTHRPNFQERSGALHTARAYLAHIDSAHRRSSDQRAGLCHVAWDA
jgi:hypothetical protein